MATFDRSSGTPLGQILLQEGVITETSLSEALRVQARERQPLGELLAARAPEYSAHVTLSGPQKLAIVGIALAALVLLGIMRGLFFIALFGAVITLYAAVVVFRVYVQTRGARSEELIRIPRRDLDAL